MLIRNEILEQIRRGDVSLAFRRWVKPTVSRGGTLLTGAGLLSIDDVAKTSLKAISERDAKQAGFASRDELIAKLQRRDGTIYRISLSYAGADPRIALRRKAKPTDDELAAILSKLAGYDRRGRHGAWTQPVLEIIAELPNVAAGSLAVELGYDKAWLKTNIRHLKTLGLTESLQPGYRISPRGATVLAALKNSTRST